MSKIVIRKRVDLYFLGEECKGAYIDFRSVPVGDYDKLIDDIKSSEGDDKKANGVILKILKNYYLGGKYPNDKGELEDIDTVDELDNLDKDALLECFGKVTGQDISGVTKAQKELAEQGASQEEIEGVQVDIDPKSDMPSKLG